MYVGYLQILHILYKRFEHLGILVSGGGVLELILEDTERQLHSEKGIEISDVMFVVLCISLCS